MIYLINNVQISGQFKTENGTTYPSNWLKLSSEEEREFLNIITLSEIYPTLEDGKFYDGGYIDDLDSKTRTYTISDISPIPS